MLKECPVLIIYQADPLGYKIGGAETFIKGFIKNSPDNFCVEFIGITSDKILRPVKKWTGLKLGNRNFTFYPLFFEKNENRKTFLPLSLRFTIALKFSNIDFDKKILFFNRIEPLILFKKNKSPKIAIIHNDILEQIFKKESEVLWSKFSNVYLIFERYIFNYLDHIYTVSKRTLEFYLKNYVKQKNRFSFLPTWVDTDMFYPADEPKYHIRKKLTSLYKFLPTEYRWILFVGRLQKQKAPARLVETFLEYYKKNRASCLILIGEGNLRTEVERCTKELDLENNVFLLGNMHQEELVDFYRASDIFLLTSNFEGMPMCVLESLGCGLPVVTTAVGEVKRIIKNGFSGEVVENFSPKDIAQSVEKVLNNPGIYTKKNCTSCIAEYTPQKVLKPIYEKMKMLYSEI